MLTVMFSMIPLLLAPHATPGDCDEVCAAVLEAAWDWTLEQAGADPDRLILDPWVGPNDPAARQAERAVVMGFEEALGLPVMARREHPAWRACAEVERAQLAEATVQSSDLEACRAGVGLTWVRVNRVETMSPTEATVWSHIRVLGGPDLGDNVLKSLQLQMERMEGEWRVTGIVSAMVS